MINIYWNGHLSKQYSIMSIYCKDNSYIAVYRSQGKTDDEKELEVKANVFYNHNHPTYEYKYCIDDYYFNLDDLGE